MKLTIKNEVKSLVKDLRNVRKPLQSPFDKAGSIIVKNYRALVKSKGHNSSTLTANKTAISKIPFRLTAGVGVVVHLWFIAMWLSGGTKIRKTRKGGNRGKIAPRRYLSETVERVAREIVRVIESAKIC